MKNPILSPVFQFFPFSISMPFPLYFKRPCWILQIVLEMFFGFGADPLSRDGMSFSGYPKQEDNRVETTGKFYPAVFKQQLWSQYGEYYKMEKGHSYCRHPSVRWCLL
jgi:hypothetical protein